MYLGAVLSLLTDFAVSVMVSISLAITGSTQRLNRVFEIVVCLQSGPNFFTAVHIILNILPVFAV